MTNLNVFRVDWEAALKNFNRAGDKENQKFSEGVLHGLKAAIDSYEKRLNGVDAIGTEPCIKCINDIMKQKIKEIEDLLAEWEAAGSRAMEDGLQEKEAWFAAKTSSFRSALCILTKPSNQAIATDVLECELCGPDTELHTVCVRCGSIVERR